MVRTVEKDVSAACNLALSLIMQILPPAHIVFVVVEV